MQEVIQQKTAEFIDRRQSSETRREGAERRQFQDSRDTFRPEVLELAEAIDQYKLHHRRRFITCDELYNVMVELGYHK